MTVGWVLSNCTHTHIYIYIYIILDIKIVIGPTREKGQQMISISIFMLLLYHILVIYSYFRRYIFFRGFWIVKFRLLILQKGSFCLGGIFLDSRVCAHECTYTYAYVRAYSHMHRHQRNIHIHIYIYICVYIYIYIIHIDPIFSRTINSNNVGPKIWPRYSHA